MPKSDSLFIFCRDDCFEIIYILIKNVDHYYFKFGNFHVTFIWQIFYFLFIREVLYLRTSFRLVLMAYSDSLLARTLNS